MRNGIRPVDEREWEERAPRIAQEPEVSGDRDVVPHARNPLQDALDVEWIEGVEGQGRRKMTDFAAACARGRARPADLRRYSRVIRVRGVAEFVI